MNPSPHPMGRGLGRGAIGNRLIEKWGTQEMKNLAIKRQICHNRASLTGTSLRMNSTLRLSVSGTVAVITAAIGIVAVTAGGLPDMQTDYVTRYEPILKSVPALELPAKSASLVTAASATQKEPVAMAIV